MSCTALQHLDDIEKVFPRIKPLLISASHSRIPLTQSSVYIPWTLPYWCHLLFSPFIPHVFCRATRSCLKVLPCNLIQYKLPPEANEKNGSFFLQWKNTVCVCSNHEWSSYFSLHATTQQEWEKKMKHKILYSAWSLKYSIMCLNSLNICLKNL